MTSSEMLLLGSLHPTLRPLAEAHLRACEAAGIPLRIIEGFRDPARQQRLFEQGRVRTLLGGWRVVDAAKIVTHAQPKDAPHCRGCAYDAAPVENGHLLLLPPGLSAEEHARQLALYARVGEIARENGLGWGGDWTSLKDYDHFELVGWRAMPYPMQQALVA